MIFLYNDLFLGLWILQSNAFYLFGIGFIAIFLGNITIGYLNNFINKVIIQFFYNIIILEYKNICQLLISNWQMICYNRYNIFGITVQERIF